jgi:hypothetical protein
MGFFLKTDRDGILPETSRKHPLETTPVSVDHEYNG